MKNSYEVRFKRLAEEFAPPTPKPELAKQRQGRYVTQPADIPRAQGIVRKTYPLTQVCVTTEIADEELSQEQVEDFVRRNLAQRLAEELVSLMTIERGYDINRMTTRYFARLIIADPKCVGASVEEYAMATGK